MIEIHRALILLLTDVRPTQRLIAAHELVIKHSHIHITLPFSYELRIVFCSYVYTHTHTHIYSPMPCLTMRRHSQLSAASRSCMSSPQLSSDSCSSGGSSSSDSSPTYTHGGGAGGGGHHHHHFRIPRLRRSKSTSSNLNWMDQIAWNQHSKSSACHPAAAARYRIWYMILHWGTLV